jgi:hypothetical protein
LFFRQSVLLTKCAFRLHIFLRASLAVATALRGGARGSRPGPPERWAPPGIDAELQTCTPPELQVFLYCVAFASLGTPTARVNHRNKTITETKRKPELGRTRKTRAAPPPPPPVTFARQNLHGTSLRLPLWLCLRLRSSRPPPLAVNPSPTPATRGASASATLHQQCSSRSLRR